MYSVLNCRNVAKLTEFYLGYLRFIVTSTGNAGRFKKGLYSGIPNVTVWRVIRKRVHLKAPIWNTIVKLFLKHNFYIYQSNKCFERELQRKMKYFLCMVNLIHILQLYITISYTTLCKLLMLAAPEDGQLRLKHVGLQNFIYYLQIKTGYSWWYFWIYSVLSICIYHVDQSPRYWVRGISICRLSLFCYCLWQ
jgi:hypothetical protein